MSAGRILALMLFTAVLVIAVIGLVALIYLKQHTFTARQRPPKAETMLVNFVCEASAPPTANVSNPLPATPQNIAAGRSRYARNCALCHGTDGKGQTGIGSGLYPPIPNLTDRDSQAMSDSAIYHTLRNGIPFSGMPAFNGPEESYWTIVLFLRHLPQMTTEEVQEVSRIAEGCAR
jgi:mono/diheme cytochrome c family protein